MTEVTGIDHRRVGAVHEAELERFAAEHPRSRERFERGRRSLVGGVCTLWLGALPSARRIARSDGR